MFTALHQRYLKCELLYAEDQRLEVNRQELTPSLLNYQVGGTHLQDGVLWDVEKWDIVECPVCHHQSAMRMDDVQTINTYNQGAHDAVTAKGSNGTFTAKKPRHGCYAYMLLCNGCHDGSNCPECVWRVCNRERLTRMCGKGECPFSCSLCLSRCQVLFKDVHRYAITNAIDLSSKKKKKVGRGEAKQPEEMGHEVVSRALSNALENNLVYESQMRNGRLDDKLMQDAKTNSALDLIQNPMYTIDLSLSLRRKLSKEITLTSDVRLSDNGVGSGATVDAAGGAAAMTDGVVTAFFIYLNLLIHLCCLCPHRLMCPLAPQPPPILFAHQQYPQWRNVESKRRILMVRVMICCSNSAISQSGLVSSLICWLMSQILYSMGPNLGWYGSLGMM